MYIHAYAPPAVVFTPSSPGLRSFPSKVPLSLKSKRPSFGGNKIDPSTIEAPSSTCPRALVFPYRGRRSPSSPSLGADRGRLDGLGTKPETLSNTNRSVNRVDGRMANRSARNAAATSGRFDRVFRVSTCMSRIFAVCTARSQIDQKIKTSMLAMAYASIQLWYVKLGQFVSPALAQHDPCSRSKLAAHGCKGLGFEDMWGNREALCSQQLF